MLSRFLLNLIFYSLVSGILPIFDSLKEGHFKLIPKDIIQSLAFLNLGNLLIRQHSKISRLLKGKCRL